jgi:3-hydroxybutyryl-CoA dehydrogenase
MEIKKVGVMGCGAMGLGVAQVCAQAGIPTVVVKATPGSTDKIRAGLEKSLAKMVERGKMTAEKKDSTLGLLRFTTSRSGSRRLRSDRRVHHRGSGTKKAMFQRLEGIVSPQALLTTNTSTLVGDRDDGGLQAARPGGRSAFLQPGTGDEAGRDHPRLRNFG